MALVDYSSGEEEVVQKTKKEEKEKVDLPNPLELLKSTKQANVVPDFLKNVESEQQNRIAGEELGQTHTKQSKIINNEIEHEKEFFKGDYEPPWKDDVKQDPAMWTESAQEHQYEKRKAERDAVKPVGIGRKAMKDEKKKGRDLAKNIEEFSSKQGKKRLEQFGSWRQENAKGGWKSKEEMVMRQGYD